MPFRLAFFDHPAYFSPPRPDLTKHARKARRRAGVVAACKQRIAMPKARQIAFPEPFRACKRWGVAYAVARATLFWGSSVYTQQPSGNPTQNRVQKLHMCKICTAFAKVPKASKSFQNLPKSSKIFQNLPNCGQTKAPPFRAGRAGRAKATPHRAADGRPGHRQTGRTRGPD